MVEASGVDAYISWIIQLETWLSGHQGKENLVGITQHAVVKPNHNAFTQGTVLMGYVSGSFYYAVPAGGVGGVATTLKQTVDGVWRSAGGGVEESVSSGGVGGEI